LFERQGKKVKFCKQVEFSDGVDIGLFPGWSDQITTPPIKINACFAGSGGSDSIAYAISKQLGRETHAYDGGTHFGPTHTGSDGKPYPPTHPPVYLLPDKGTKEVVFP
jgi:hypothetical protein